MRQLWDAVAQTLGGLTLIITLLVGTGAGLFHMGLALASTTGRRAAILAAGVDPMPVGTAKQVERAKQARPAKP